MNEEGDRMSDAMDWCNEEEMDTWSDSEICEYYDNHPNLSNKAYAQMLDISCTDLNDILMDRG